MVGHSLISAISENYRFLKVLGQGCYGHVIKCLKQDTEEVVAVKVLKQRHSKLKNIREVIILEKLRSLDPDKSNIIRCHEWFHRMDQTFMVFEMLDMSVHDFMHQRKWAPLPINGIRTIIKDMATALNAMKGVGLIHTDLKLDNIMLVDHQRQPFRVRLIDFGLTLHKFEATPGLGVQPLWHRSPEILFGIPFTEAIDIWSLGSIMAQMLLGFALFPGRHEYDVLRFIVELLGQPPKRLLNDGKYTELFYHKSLKYGLFKHWTLKTPVEFYSETGIKPMDTRKHRLSSLDEIKIRYLNQENSTEAADMSASVELLKEMLQMLPRKRITPSKILAHPFIMGSTLNPSNSSQYEPSPECPVKPLPGVVMIKPAQKTVKSDRATKQRSVTSSQAMHNKRVKHEDLILESITDSVKTSPAVASDIKSIPLVSPNRHVESPDSPLNYASDIINSEAHTPEVSEPKKKKQMKKKVRQFFSTLKRTFFSCFHVSEDDGVSLQTLHSSFYGQKSPVSSQDCRPHV